MKSDTKRAKLPTNNPTIKKAYYYYLKDLTAKEIGLLISISSRTVQRIIKDNSFKELAQPNGLNERILELKAKGLSYTEIANALKCSRTTVYNHLKAVRERIEQDVFA